MARLSNDPKPRKGKKPTAAEAKKLVDAVALMKTTYADVLGVWSQATETQKTAYLANSPILADLLGWSDLWQQ